MCNMMDKAKEVFKGFCSENKEEKKASCEKMKNMMKKMCGGKLPCEEMKKAFKKMSGGKNPCEMMKKMKEKWEAKVKENPELP